MLDFRPASPAASRTEPFGVKTAPKAPTLRFSGDEPDHEPQDSIGQDQSPDQDRFEFGPDKADQTETSTPTTTPPLTPDHKPRSRKRWLLPVAGTALIAAVLGAGAGAIGLGQPAQASNAAANEGARPNITPSGNPPPTGSTSTPSPNAEDPFVEYTEEDPVPGSPAQGPDTPATPSHPSKTPAEGAPDSQTEEPGANAPETPTTQPQQPASAPTASPPATGSGLQPLPPSDGGQVLAESVDGASIHDESQDVNNVWHVVPNQYVDIRLKKAGIDSSNHARSEAQFDSVPNERENVFEYSFQVAPDNQTGPDEEFIVGQLHGNDTTSPPLALTIVGDNMYLDYRTSGDHSNKIPLGPVEKGKWYNVRFDIRPSQTNGMLKLSINGEEKDLKLPPNPQVGYPSGDSYWKVGVYWWDYKDAPTSEKHVLVANVRLTQK